MTTIAQQNPNDLVVSVEDAKNYLNIDYPTWDDLIEMFIRSATQSLQRFTGVLFLPSTVKLVKNQRIIKGQCNYITIPYSNGAELTTTGYELTGNRIYTDDPTVTVEYTAGQTEDWMKTAVLKYVADMFIHRGEEGFDSGKEARIFCAPYISHGGWF